MIPFTQFLRPDGEQKTIQIQRSPEIEAVAAQLIAAGCRLEAEVLRTGECSFTCERGEQVLAIEVCQNGPPVLAAVDKLIAEAIGQLAAGEAVAS
jgi:hypothetical protein